MVIVVRAIQAILLLFTLGTAITAFTFGLNTYGGADGQCLVNEDGEVNAECPVVQNYEAQGGAIIGIALAGVATAAGAAALNGMVRKQRHPAQPDAHRPAPRQAHQPHSGPMPQQPHPPGPQQYYQQPPSP